MEVEQATAAPTVEGVPGQTPESQEAQAPSQEKPESQETVQPQSRGDGQQPSSNGGTRKPSEFYKERERYKNKIANLESQLSEIKTLITSQKKETSVPPPPSAPPIEFDKAKWWDEPKPILEQILKDREKFLLDEFNRKLDEKFNQNLDQRELQRKLKSEEQEALELIFPKTGQDDKRTLAQRMNADPEHTEKVLEILANSKIGAIANDAPKEAAELLLLKLEKLRAEATPKPQAPKNPNAIKKSLVGSTATGSPTSSGGKTMPTLAEIKSQLEQLSAQADKKPELRFDQAWRTKREQLKDQLTVLHKELSGKVQ